MSLDAPHARGIGLPTNVQVSTPAADYDGFACPRCHRSLTDDDVGTPRVPSDILVDDALVNALRAAEVDRVPAFGWQCERHRRETVIPAPYHEAPAAYAPVDAEIDGQQTTIAVPTPVIDDYQ